MKHRKQPKPRPGSPRRTMAAKVDANAPPGNLFDRRRRRIEGARGISPQLRRMALSICAFDRLTDPVQLAEEGRVSTAKAVLELTQFLIHRVKQRAGYGLQRLEFEPNPLPRLGDASGRRERIQEVERVFREALQSAFQTSGSTVFAMHQFQRAFAAFVGGELSLGAIAPIPPPDDLALHGVPDGPNYFCLAEAVLLFLHCGMHARFWTPLLRTFVGGAQFFAACYWDRTGRHWGAYRGGDPKTLVPSAVVLAAIDHLYAAMDSSQLAAQFTGIVGLALRDEPNLPWPQTTAKELL